MYPLPYYDDSFGDAIGVYVSLFQNWVFSFLLCFFFLFGSTNVPVHVDGCPDIGLASVLEFDTVGISFVPVFEDDSLDKASDVGFDGGTDGEPERVGSTARHESFP